MLGFEVMSFFLRDSQPDTKRQTLIGESRVLWLRSHFARQTPASVEVHASYKAESCWFRVEAHGQSSVSTTPDQNRLDQTRPQPLLIPTFVSIVRLLCGLLALGGL